MVRPLRLSCAAAVLVLFAFLWAPAPKIAAAGSNDASSGNCCEESCEESPPPLNPNPGNPGEEPPPSVPASNPIRIDTTQTAVAVIHVIRTATRPANVDSELLFTVISVFPEDRFWNWEIVAQGGGDMSTPGGSMPRFPLQSSAGE
ncbi:MAG TPA: hypothetical protein VFN72_05910 [Solirubrobacterales bacterium]|nr:hypothetical protein [Solirubrobacterales bacterium]